MNTKKRFLRILLGLVLMLGVVTGMSLTAYAADHTHNGWSEITALPQNSGSYYLTNDVSLSGSWNVPVGITNLCLNGHSISGSNKCTVIKVPSGATLNIYTESSEEPQRIWKGKGNGIAGGVYVNTGGTFNMYGGSIESNVGTDYGGGVFCEGTMTLDGVTVQNNTVNKKDKCHGGGLNIGHDQENESGEVSATLNNCKICNNTALNSGGNAPDGWGGAIFVDWNCEVTITDTTIQGNSAKNSGGIHLEHPDSKVIIMNSTITKNNSTANLQSSDDGYGAGVNLDNNKLKNNNLKVAGAVRITGNTPGNVWLPENTFVTVDKTLLPEAKIGVTTKTNPTSTSPVVITSGLHNKGTTNLFSSDNPAYVVTLNGSKEAQLAPHTHNFTYTASGNTITATCSAEGCGLPPRTEGGNDHVATLTIDAPALTVFGGTESPEATITDANSIRGNAAVSYFATDASGGKTGNALTVAPTDAGTYWAEITLGTGNDAATAHVVYEIGISEAETGFTLDYVAETFTINEGYEASSTNADSGLLPDNSLTAILDGSDSPVIYVRKKATDNANASAWLAINLPARPDAPTGLRTISQNGNNGVGAIIYDTITALECRKTGTNDAWTAFLDKGVMVAEVQTGQYDVRFAGVNDGDNSHFASAATPVTVGLTYNIWVAGTEVTGDSATQSGEGWSFDPDANKLTLNNFSSSVINQLDEYGTSYSVIYNGSSSDLTIELIGNNTLDGSAGAVAAHGYFTGNSSKTIFTGSGTLHAIGSSSDSRAGIYTVSDATIQIDGGVIIAEGYYGISSYKSININGGNVTAIGSEKAIYAAVKNSIPGEGWDNVAGQGQSKEIPKNNTLDWNTITSFKKVHFKDPHTHDFTYSASGATIAATCKEDGCMLTLVEGKPTATLTIAEPLHTTYGDGKVATAVITDADSIQGDAKVQYQKKTGETTYDTATDTAPTDAGTYKASITVGGATASVEYTIAKADSTANAPTGLTATYGQTLANVSLEGKNPEGNTPGTWAWVDSTQSVGNVVSPAATFKAIFTPDSSNYKTVENVDVTVTVSKAANPATVAGTATVIKGGNTVDLAMNVTKNGATGDVSYAFDGEAKGCTLSGSVLTSGDTTGTVTVNVTVAADSNYEALAATPITVTISDKGTQTITAADVTATYGDTDKKISATTNGDGALSYAIKSGDAVTVNATTGALTIAKAGCAVVTVTAAETAAYAQATKDVNVTINKANAVPATITANSRNYDGTDQPLVTVTGEAVGGEMQYAIGTVTEATGTYAKDIPTATNVGTYTVWYKVKGDDNHNDGTPASVKVTIAPKQVGLKWTNTKFTYNGKSHAPTATATGLVSGDTCTVTVTGAQTNAGTYTATASKLSNANYKLPSATTTSFTIGKKEVGLSWSDTSFTYDGQSHIPTATATGLADGDACKVTVEGGQTNAGTYTATATALSNDNYKLPDTSTASFTIEKAEPGTPQVTMQGYTYGGTLPTPSIGDYDGGGAVTWYYSTSDSNSGGTAWTDSMTATSLYAGTYYMYAVIAPTENYLGYTTQTSRFEITPGVVTVSGTISFGNFSGNLILSLLSSDGKETVASDSISVSGGKGTFHFEHITQDQYILRASWSEGGAENVLNDELEIR